MFVIFSLQGFINAFKFNQDEDTYCKKEAKLSELIVNDLIIFNFIVAEAVFTFWPLMCHSKKQPKRKFAGKVTPATL